MPTDHLKKRRLRIKQEKDITDLALLALNLVQQPGIIEVDLIVTEAYAHLRIPLSRGSAWEGGYLHSMQELLYEKGYKYNLKYQHENNQLVMDIWPIPDEGGRED
jgi:hypothetical protein